MHANESAGDIVISIDADTAMIHDLTRTLNGVYIPLTVLLERLHAYFHGWLRFFFTHRRGAIADV